LKLAQIHELKYQFKREDIEKLDNLITYLQNILLERTEAASKIKESFFVHEIPNYQIDVKNITLLDNLRKNKAITLEEKLQKKSSVKNSHYPIDMNLHNNDYSQRLLEGISQNIKEVQINMQNSMKELKDQGQSIKQAHNEVNYADGEMDFANVNINQISSKRRCQIVLMYITAITLFFVIVLLIGFKYLRA